MSATLPAREHTTPPASGSSLASSMVLGGKYRLLHEKGVGGMGVVWAARNEATGGEVALKIVLPDAEHAVKCGERLRREAQVTAMLSHRGVVQVYDFFETYDGLLVLVLELLRGHTVAERIEHAGGLPVQDAVTIARAVLTALTHVHAVGIVHRDIKPENIFLSADTDCQVTPKLLDFGIAKEPHGANSLTMPGELLGTPRYMSPEQLMGEAVDGRSDLFAIGILLYEMVSGRHPFGDEGRYPVAVTSLHDVAPLEDIPPAVAAVIARAMQRSPSERYADAAQMADALRDAMELEAPPPVSTPRHALTSRTSRTSRAFRVPRRAWVPAAAALLGVAGYFCVDAASATHDATRDFAPVHRSKVAHVPATRADPPGLRAAYAPNEAKCDDAPVASTPARVAPPLPSPAMPSFSDLRLKRGAGRIAIANEPGF